MALHTVRCQSCGVPFEASRSDATTCSTTCRVRRHRDRQAREVTRAAALLASVAHLLDDTARADAARLSEVLPHAG